MDDRQLLPSRTVRRNILLWPRSYMMKQRAGLGKKVSSIFDGVPLPKVGKEVEQAPPRAEPPIVPPQRSADTATQPAKTPAVPPQAPASSARGSDKSACPSSGSAAADTCNSSTGGNNKPASPNAGSRRRHPGRRRLQRLSLRRRRESSCPVTAV